MTSQTLDINATVTYSYDSEQVRPKVPVWAYEVLKQTNSKMNRRFSKSIITGEVLFLYGYTSRLTQTEETINRQLDSEVSPGFSDSLDNIQSAGANEADLHAAGEIEGVEDPEQLTDHQIDFWLPPHVKDELPGRGIGTEIADAVIHFHKSPYRSVSDRLDAKSQILDYAQTGEEPTHPVARAVCLRDGTGSYIGVPDVTVSVGSSSTPNSSADAEDEEWWESDNLMLENLFDRDHTASGDGLSQKQRDERIQALETVVRNMPRAMTKDDVAVKVRNIYGVSTDSVVDEYLDEMDESVFADPIDKISSAKSGATLSHLTEYANDPEMQARVLDKLFGSYYEATGETEFYLYNADAMVDGWMSVAQIMYEAGWVGKHELPDSPGRFFRDYVQPVLSEADNLGHVYATDQIPTSKIVVSEDYLEQADTPKPKSALSNFNLYK